MGTLHGSIPAHIVPVRSQACRQPPRSTHSSPVPGGPFEVVTEEVRRPSDAGLQGPDAGAAGDRRASRPPTATQTFIVYGDRARSSFSDFMPVGQRRVSRAARRFGVGHGDRVAVLSANNPEWCLTFWGTVDLGAILVGLNGWWKNDEILYGLQDSGAKVLVADRQRFERIADEISTTLPGPRSRVPDRRRSPADFAGGETAALLHRFDELTGSTVRRAADDPIDEDDPAVIFYTSGTTGRPKGAICTHRNMIANLQNTMLQRVAGAMTGDGAPIPTATCGGAGQTGRALHLAAVPRVGLPLDAGGRAAWPASSWSCPTGGSSRRRRSS